MALALLEGEVGGEASDMKMRLQSASVECLRGCHVAECAEQAVAEAKAAFQTARREELPLQPAFALVARQLEAEGHVGRAEAAVKESLKGTGGPPSTPPTPWLVMQAARLVRRQGNPSQADTLLRDAAEELASWIELRDMDFGDAPTFSFEGGVEELLLEAGKEAAKAGDLDKALRHAQAAQQSALKCGEALRWLAPAPGLSPYPAQALELALLVAKAQATGDVSPAAIGKARALAKTGNLSRRDPAWTFLAAQVEALAATRSGAERASTMCLKAVSEWPGHPPSRVLACAADVLKSSSLAAAVVHLQPWVLSSWHSLKSLKSPD
eukprot:jgi/Botrbrau1/13376/Bobra.0194s0008.1